uniref:Immunoglobulin heavy variable 6-1 n=1 Tax=Poecilia latipinna TaxID=48699 RepID=A0A3B3VHX2_9TELE
MFMLTGVGGQTLTESEPVLKRPGESHTLTCTLSVDKFGDYWMNWVREAPGKGLEWVAIISFWAGNDGSNTAYSSRVDGRIEITRENSNSLVHLKLSNLKPEDSAVYYCARNAQ